MTYIPTTHKEYNQQGKSNSYIATQQEGGLTAGQAAKMLSRRLGVKILAKELEPLTKEYHHAGRFGKNQARRVFFFTPKEVDRITLEDIRQASTPQWGWVLAFKRVKINRFGKMGYRPIIGEAGAIPADKVHRLGDKFHPLSKDEAKSAIKAVGKELPPYSSNWQEAF